MLTDILAKCWGVNLNLDEKINKKNISEAQKDAALKNIGFDIEL